MIVADPPWLYKKNPGLKSDGRGGRGYAEEHYPTLTNEDIAAMPVRDLAADDAHLFMWFTNPGVFGGRFSDVTPADIAKAWGFEFKTLITWVKTTAAGDVHGGGMGWYFRGCTEHILYATRGKASIASARRVPNVLMAPRGRHSEKPQAFFDMVEHVIPGARYVELFARSPRPGWSAWGNDPALAEETHIEPVPVTI